MIWMPLCRMSMPYSRLPGLLPAVPIMRKIVRGWNGFLRLHGLPEAGCPVVRQGGRRVRFSAPYVSYTPRHQRMIAFWACRRFSASSQITECGPSITSEVTSSSRCAGRQCMKSASGLASAISAALTW